MASPVPRPAEGFDFCPSEHEQPEVEEFHGTPRFDLLDLLFAFLSSPDELNPVLCGYFQKLVFVFQRRHSAKLLAYVYANSAVINNMLKHIGSKSVADVLVRLITTDEGVLISGDPQNAAQLYTALQATRAHVVAQLVAMILRQPESEQHEETFDEEEARINACNVLTELCEDENFSRALCENEAVLLQLCGGVKHKKTISGVAHVLRALLRSAGPK